MACPSSVLNQQSLHCETGSKLAQLNLFDPRFETFSQTKQRYFVEYDAVIGETIQIGCFFPDNYNAINAKAKDFDDNNINDDNLGKFDKLRKKRQRKDLAIQNDESTIDEELKRNPQIFYKLNASKKSDNANKNIKISSKLNVQVKADALKRLNLRVVESKSIPTPQEYENNDSDNSTDSSISDKINVKDKKLSNKKNSAELEPSLPSLTSLRKKNKGSSPREIETDSVNDKLNKLLRSLINKSYLMGYRSRISSALKSNTNVSKSPRNLTNLPGFDANIINDQLPLPKSVLNDTISQIKKIVQNGFLNAKQCKIFNKFVANNVCGFKKSLLMTYKTLDEKFHEVDVGTTFYIPPIDSFLINGTHSHSEEDLSMEKFDVGRFITINMKEHDALLECSYFSLYTDATNRKSCLCSDFGKQMVILKVRKTLLLPSFIHASMEVLSLRPIYIFNFRCRISRCIPPIRLSLRIEFDDGTYDIVMQDLISDMRYTSRIHDYIVPYEIPRDQLKNFSYTCYWNFENHRTLVPNSITLYHKTFVDNLEGIGISLYLHIENILNSNEKSSKSGIENIPVLAYLGQTIKFVCNPLFGNPTDFAFSWYFEESLLINGQDLQMRVTQEYEGNIYCIGKILQNKNKSNNKGKATTYKSSIVSLKIQFESMRTNDLSTKKEIVKKFQNVTKKQEDENDENLNDLDYDSDPSKKIGKKIEAHSLIKLQGMKAKIGSIVKALGLKGYSYDWVYSNFGKRSEETSFLNSPCFDDKECQIMAPGLKCNLFRCTCTFPSIWLGRDCSKIPSNILIEQALSAKNELVKNNIYGNYKNQYLLSKGSWRLGFLATIGFLAIGLVLILWLSAWVHLLKKYQVNNVQPVLRNGQDNNGVDLTNFALQQNPYSEYPLNYSPFEFNSSTLRGPNP
ncbi:unnamed protein product [Gordionus sp. m RMFG-2023]